MRHSRRADAIRVSPFVLTWARVLGVSLPEVARAASIPLERLESLRELSYDETISIWHALETLTRDPLVGLHAGARFSIDQMGVVGPALAHTTHLDSALDVLARVMDSFVQHAGIRRVDDVSGGGIEYRMPELRSRHGVDTMFAATVALVRHCTERRVVPVRVEHQMPRCSEREYEAFYGVLPMFDRPASQLWFSRADLALPFRGASPELSSLLATHAPRLLTGEARATGAEEQFERAFWAAHAEGEATLETVAEALGVSARTLQRRLGAMDTTFAKRRGDLLHRRAMQLLRDTSTPIETIAHRLGYTSRAAFERAFVRWAGGKTPHAARQAAGQDH